MGFGKRKKTKEEPVLKVSPSLPNIGQQAVAWGNLVDPAELREDGNKTPVPATPAKLSFQTLRGSIPFHKPFRPSVDTAATPQGDGSIASLYARQPAPGAAAAPPSAFKRGIQTSSMYVRSRRPKVAHAFNLMVHVFFLSDLVLFLTKYQVAGGQGTGKSSLLRLLLETCDLSPNATTDQRTAVDKYVRSSSRPTTALQTACIEICETKVRRNRRGRVALFAR